MKIRYVVEDYSNNVDYTSNGRILESRFKLLALLVGFIKGKEVERITIDGNAEHLEDTLLQQKNYE